MYMDAVIYFIHNFTISKGSVQLVLSLSNLIGGCAFGIHTHAGTSTTHAHTHRHRP